MILELSQLVTSIHLSKRMAELGAPMKTLFYYTEIGSGDYILCAYIGTHLISTVTGNIFGNRDVLADTPAYLSGEIETLLPECYKTERRLNGEYECLQDFTSVTDSSGHKFFERDSIVHLSTTEAEVRGMCWCHLKESKLI